MLRKLLIYQGAKLKADVNPNADSQDEWGEAHAVNPLPTPQDVIDAQNAAAAISKASHTKSKK